MNDNVHPFRSPSTRDAYLSRYDEQAKRWSIPLETRLATTSYGDTFVRINGPSGAPSLVLVPGDEETSSACSLVVEALSADYNIFCLDHINDLDRSVPKRPVKRHSDFVEWLDEVLTALGLNRFHLMGHSYGG